MEALNAMHLHTHTLPASTKPTHPNDIQRIMIRACVGAREVRAKSRAVDSEKQITKMNSYSLCVCVSSARAST